MTVTQGHINQAKPLASYKKGSRVRVHDKMQQGYEYVLAEAPGKALDPRMKGCLTPQRVLQLGAFDGKYLRDCYDELPKEWYQKGKFATGAAADPSVNYFGIKSRQSLQEWHRKGWIPIAEGDPDVRGWFQWFCRYWLGRRDDRVDELQIKRWANIKRHQSQIEKHCAHEKNAKGGCCDPKNCRPKQRQTLLNWARNPFI